MNPFSSFYPRALLSILPLLLLIPGCGPEAETAPPPPPMVTVAPPAQQDVTEYAEYTGLTQAFETVEIRARVEGVLEKFLFTPGERVQKGRLLFQIDDRPFKAGAAEAEAERVRQQAQLDLAEATLQRKEQAFTNKGVSEIELINARGERDALKAAVKAAEAAVERAHLDLSYTRIEAPTSGTIGRNLVDAGNLVGAGEETWLATIVRDDPIYVYFHMNERDLLRLRAQNPAWGDGKVPLELGLSDSADYPFKGRIDFIDNRVEKLTGSIEVRGVFPNEDGRLLSGLFARIRLPVAHLKSAFVVPDRAVMSDQQGDYLFVVDADNRVGVRPVRTGTRVNDMRVIEEGIGLEDRVIVNGLLRARPGLVVSPRTDDDQSAAAQERS